MNQNSNKITNKNIMVENINRLLYQKNWSIRQLADEAELPYESVKKLVGGKVNNPTIYTISKVCDALNCSIDYILGRSVINTIDKKSLPPRVFNLLVEIAYFVDDFLNGGIPEVVCLTYGYGGNNNPAARVQYNKAGIYAQDEWHY